jgi:O-antigen/teichoic acid export membrane protein
MALVQRIQTYRSGRSNFAKNIAKVSAGQVAVTLITMGALPIVTRLYAPEHFGNLQLLLSVALSFSAIAALKYETAIVLPAEREQSNQVAALSLLVLAGTTLVFGAVVALFGAPLLRFLNAEILVPWAGLVVVAFVWGGLMKVSQHALIAGRHFGSLSRNNVILVACTQATSIAYGLWRPEFLGLVLAQFVGQFTGIFLAFRVAPIRFAGLTRSSLGKVAARYKKFPLVNSPGVLLNSLAAELPVFMLTKFFAMDVVGFYMVATRILNQPMVIFGQSVSQVYLQSAAQERQRGVQHLEALYRSTLRRLALAGLVPAAIVLGLAPPLISLVLGPEWREVGIYMQILMLGKYFNFITTPVSTTFSILDRQEVGVAVMVLSAVGRLGAMVAYSDSAESMLIALSVATAVFSIVYNLAIYWVLAVERRR